MIFSTFENIDSQEVVQLFLNVFSDSEGESEGKTIANLVSELITTTQSVDLIGCVAKVDESIVGTIFFSRFSVPNGQSAFILSPVAISTPVQGKGVGQTLITYGLNYLRSLGVELVFTYGDPKFYSKVGFVQISEDVVKAPFKLSYPMGWLGQALEGDAIPVMSGKAQCVNALSDQKYW